MRLYTPGPVSVPASVMAACGEPPLFHRGAEFKDVAQRVWTNLRSVFCTTQPVILLAGSGMTGIEAAMASTVRPGDAVVVLEHGRFGERLTAIAGIYGASVTVLRVPWGQTITSGMVADHLRTLDRIDHVWLVHSETSTGVTLDLEAIASTVTAIAPNALLGVDAITSLAIHPVLTDAWGLDMVVTASQKGFACPPGLAAVSVSTRAEARMRALKPVSYTLHLPTVLDSMEKGLFPWTPPVTLVRGLDVALGMLLEEGMDNVWQRHTNVTQYLHDALRARSLPFFGNATSHAVTVVEHARSTAIKTALAERHGMVIAGGQDQLQHRVFRIGTIGWIDRADIDALMHAIDDVL